MSETTDQVTTDEVAPASSEASAVAELETLRLQLDTARASRNAALQPTPDVEMSPERAQELANEKVRLEAELAEVLETSAKETGASVEDIKASMLAQVEEVKAAQVAQAEAVASAEPVDPAAEVVAPNAVDSNTVPPPPGEQNPPPPDVPEVPPPGGTTPAEGEAVSTDSAAPTTTTGKKGGSR